MHLDHFVVHVDSVETPVKIVTAARQAGFPFNPRKGKGDKGFHTTNIWIGREYFEIAWLKRPDGGAWIPEWIERYQRGARGIVCLFLRTNSLEDLSREFSAKGLKHRVERTSFKVLFGLYTVRLPWRILLLPPIPGTDLELSFIEYDPGVVERFAKHWKPNAADNGISGICSARINVPDLVSATDFLNKVFPNCKSEQSRLIIPVDDGEIEIFESADKIRVVLIANALANVDLPHRQFEIEDVRVLARPQG